MRNRQAADAPVGNAPDEEVEQEFQEFKEITTPVLQGDECIGRVGAFEAARYRAKGLYRPGVDCIMFMRNPENLCRIGSAALEQMIDLNAE